jgi:PTH1 family peptidyl-tRNA hydrolase
MKLLVGLGNYGKKYENTRHNIGFNVIDKIADKYNFPEFQNKFKSFYSEGEIAGVKVKLLKPQTYMNNSGQAVIEVKNFYKLYLNEILVFHDELDLDLKRAKIKTAGSDGGHNGLKSIDELVGKDYKRFRFGISRPEFKTEVTSFVLSKFNSDEQKIIDEELDFITKNINLLIEGKDNIFLSKFAMHFKE